MMRPVSLSELAAPLGGRLQGGDCRFGSVSTDSRALAAGDLFVALRGEHFDAHDYLQQVAEEGAAGAMVSAPAEVALPQLVVKDTRVGLGRLGAFNRDLYTGPLVAITGSSGKTTVKNMVQAILSRHGETVATQGNLNNEIGVPLTLLRFSGQTRYAVVEMGAARAGDIAWLCELGRPTVSVLVNAMPAHLEGFGSVDDVAAAKGEIFDGLGQGATAVINADQPWAAQWRRRAGTARVLDFGVREPAAISAGGINARGVEGVGFTASTPAGDMAVRLALPGEHNVANALAAIAVGLALELSLTDIRDGLESLRPVGGRLCPRRTPGGFTLIDDCYNANSGSVRAAIDVLAACPGRRSLVLGAMRELGSDSDMLHRQVGEYARASGIERFWGVGPEVRPAVDGFGAGAGYFADRAAALDGLAGVFGEDDTVLVKGSRGAGMEQIVEALLAVPAAVGD